ncbi:hypothetical protein A6V36_37670 [Paraburkholderia ginsengiterrae]|uniref:Uncharacterized protein n=1 Tax=Paraburkholderia ginsengiterrae TaxID=1462993 RepID=A0ABX2V2N5_9BURK|nr:hypothetical protein A6V36_37670 [Paraburkholderia ginsengiterrae]
MQPLYPKALGTTGVELPRNGGRGRPSRKLVRDGVAGPASERADGDGAFCARARRAYILGLG